MHTLRASLLGAAAVALLPAAGRGQQMDHMDHMAAADSTAGMAGHAMWSADLGAGWRLLGMAQAFPVVTVGTPGDEGSPLRATEAYLTQPALMANLESPGSRVVLRTTLNLEGVTQEGGELTFGGWGEGFLDKRHPHTLLHELVLSVNGWSVLGGEASLSAGKGFAPYGTDDPMARPSLKYPTNHHLSQILERWTVSGAFLRGGWSVEGGVFGASEPTGPYDLSNVESFPDSWSARLTKRWGPGAGTMAAWEASVSHAAVAEEHAGAEETTRLWNAALRHDRAYGFGRAYALAEFSRSDPEHEDGYASVLIEGLLRLGRHEPYARVEFATRPEYARRGAPGTDGFFRYDHDASPSGATRWTIANAGYGLVIERGALSVRPFVDAQLHRVERERGPASLAPRALFGDDSFWAFSAGVRIHFGGGPMRMGSYGVLDAMTSMRRAMAPAAEAMPGMPGMQHDGH